MQIAVLAAAIFAYTLVMMLSWRRVRSAEHMSGRVESIMKIGAVNNSDANELSLPFAERFLKPKLDGIMKWLSGVMPKTDNPKLANNLKIAGIRSKPGEYNASRLVAALTTGIAATIIAVLLRLPVQAVAAFLPAGMAVGLIFMRYLLYSKIRRRKAAIQRQLPEVLDLLSVSVEAGLGFDAALQRVSERAKGPLIDELNATYMEITLGRPRAEALRNFEQRCGLEEIKSFVSSIIQAEQLGISLKNVLKTQAQQMRLLKRQRIEEKAMKAPVKIMFPLVFFVFPVLMLMLMGPAIINILSNGGIFGK